MILYRIAVIVCYPVFWVLYQLRIRGRANIPHDAAVICCNHTSLLDPVLLALVFGPRHPLRFMAKKELFQNPFLGRILKWAGAFPVDRGTADLGTIRTSLELLKSGHQVGIFPEGKRVRPGEEQDGDVKTGIAMIAARAGVPLIPVYVSRHKRVFRKTLVVIGTPISAALKEGTKAENYQRIAGEVFDTIRTLGGEDWK